MPFYNKIVFKTEILSLKNCSHTRTHTHTHTHIYIYIYRYIYDNFSNTLILNKHQGLVLQPRRTPAIGMLIWRYIIFLSSISLLGHMTLNEKRLSREGRNLREKIRERKKLPRLLAPHFHAQSPHLKLCLVFCCFLSYLVLDLSLYGDNDGYSQRMDCLLQRRGKRERLNGDPGLFESNTKRLAETFSLCIFFATRKKNPVR